MPFSETQPRAIVFDVGGVLLDWNPRHLYRKLFAGDEAAMEYFLTHICSATWNLMQDAGRTFEEGVTELIGRYPEHRDLIIAYHERWEEMIPEAIDETIEVLRSLRERHTPLYSITNFSAEKFALTRRRFGFFQWFNGIVVSGEVRLIKPDPAIYLHLLQAYGLRAQECIFVDDLPLNLEGAERVGMGTIHFQSPAQLRYELEKRELL